ncbi:MAG: hypothetical protein IKM03_02650 [Alistipes sp.]|nr:hypothetical protein [Alistipes sp.]
MNRFLELKNIAKQSLRMAAVLLAFIATTLSTACTEEVETGPKRTYVEGVTLPLSTYVIVPSDGKKVTVAFETDAAFTLEKEDDHNIVTSMKLNEDIVTSGKKGPQSLELMIDKNSTEQERTVKIYITVEGFNKTTLLTIQQSTKYKDMDEVTKYMDKRLREEYYWLDEYNEKWQSFDFKVQYKTEDAYNEMLLKNLGNMTTNKADGGVNYNGKRYIYTNVAMIPQHEYNSSMTRAGGAVTYGYGFDISSIILIIDDNGTESTNDDSYVFVVEHVYANSPAASSGLRRGDYISMVNGNTITGNNYNNIYYTLVTQTANSINLQKIDPKTMKEAKVTISRRQFNANPVAYSAVLNPSEEINPSGKKIGYLAYLSFDHDGDDKLIEAIQNLQAAGAEEMILDLRSNGGGSVDSAVKLSSMLIDESYVGQVCTKLVHNPKNIYYNGANQTTTFLFRKYENGDETGQDLPNLNMKKVYVIVSDGTASASEMVIMSLRGMDIEVELIGKTTEGKNSGMEVTAKTHNNYVYEFAPITFLNFNAKDEYEYSDGIKPQVDFDEILKSEKDKNLNFSLRIFPSPEAPWGNTTEDMALFETILRINGKSLFGGNAATTALWQKGATTRANTAMPIVGKEQMPRIFTSWKKSGACILQQERPQTEVSGQEN